MRKLKFTCLTPLWTGDIDSKSNVLQPTGIMGSLRWWTEIILRGMDKFICDPTTDDRCPQRDENSKIEKYCSACLIFGATGLRRLFKINFEGGKKVFTGGALNIKPNQRNRGWYLGSGIVGDIELEIIPLDKDFNENLILLPILIASRWGGIGARVQHGYGVVMIENLLEINFERFQEALSKIQEKERLTSLKIQLRNDSISDFPDIREMFFAKVQFESKSDWWKYVDGIKPDNGRNYKGYVKDPRIQAWIGSNSVPISPAIKNWVRFGKEITTKEGKKIQVSPFNEISNKTTSTWLFGVSENNKTSSKINISCAYTINETLWEFRIWGWIPRNGVPNGFDRNQFLNDLKGALDGSGSISIPWTNLLGNNTQNHRLSVWREFNSLRDTVKPNESDIKNYIQSLLRNEGGSI